MGDIAIAGGSTASRSGSGVTAQAAGNRLDGRRTLQLALAGLWLFDGVLQYQPFMYSKAFPRMLAGMAVGNPSAIAGPITWNAALVGHHLALADTFFATIQLLIGLGIAFRPTVRPALAASVAWSLGVWWFGEGLGGVLNGTASPLNGAPGAVITYALLAVLLWPTGRGTPAPFTAARAVRAHVARALWLVLWLSLAYFALTPANRAPQAVAGMISGMESGQPGWLAAIDRGAASTAAGHGLVISVALAVALAVIAAGVYLPPAVAKATLVLAIVVAVVIWVVGEALGGILTGGGTDPNSGPLLVLLALAYWPAGAASRPRSQKVGWPGDGTGVAPGRIRRPHAGGRGGERGTAGRGAAMARPRGRHRRRRRAPADGRRHGGHADGDPHHLAGHRVGGHLRADDRLVRLAGAARRPR